MVSQTLDPNSPATTALGSGKGLPRDGTVSSPNGSFRLRLTSTGPRLEQRNNGRTVAVVWEERHNGANTLNMQGEGNLVLRTSSGQKLWDSATSNNRGSVLVINDRGQIAVVSTSGVVLWLDGVPFSFPVASYDNLVYPIRTTFYYSWYPETWTVGGQPVRQNPTLGKYTLSDANVYSDHVNAMEYGGLELAVVTWWGPSTHKDRARISNLLNTNGSIKWTIYHERERFDRPSSGVIRQDLEYLYRWYAWHPRWARIDDRPVVFVYNDSGCDVSERWMAASRGEWFVVLKLFPGYLNCRVQPDSWHAYGPLVAVQVHRPFSHAISPGFWRADRGSAGLGRVREAVWRENVESMSRSDVRWQIVTTFNEWGEGTAVESAREWRSSSGYGMYLDVLHDALR